MKSDNVVQTKSYDFALRIVKVSNYLSQEKKEFLLSKQLLRRGMSIGSNQRLISLQAHDCLQRGKRIKILD